jgi:hypothetical protein
VNARIIDIKGINHNDICIAREMRCLRPAIESENKNKLGNSVCMPRCSNLANSILSSTVVAASPMAALRHHNALVHSIRISVNPLDVYRFRHSPIPITVANRLVKMSTKDSGAKFQVIIGYKEIIKASCFFDLLST